MMRMKTKTTEMATTTTQINGNASKEFDWELRPGGMLVQKRNPDSDQDSVPAPTIRVKVKFGSSSHDIYISSQATIGELKKLLAAPTGLHPQDQKLLFKDKERDSNSFLDIVGVKDRSKIVLVEDQTSQERRFLEMRKNAKIEKASKSISQISLEVDKLAGKVSALESVISNGGKVSETEVLDLIELLMNQLIKLDGIFVDGDVKLQRRMQVKRVQKYVETLDMLKLRNSMSSNNGSQIPMQQQQQQRQSNGQIPISIVQQQQQRYSNGQISVPIVQQQQQQQRYSNGQIPIPIVQQQQQQQQQQQRQSNGQIPIPIVQQQRHLVGQMPTSSVQQQRSARDSASGAVVVTTKWETFDSGPAHVSDTSTSTTVPPKFNWEFFD